MSNLIISLQADSTVVSLFVLPLLIPNLYLEDGYIALDCPNNHTDNISYGIYTYEKKPVRAFDIEGKFHFYDPVNMNYMFVGDYRLDSLHMHGKDLKSCDDYDQWLRTLIESPHRIADLPKCSIV